MTIGMVVAVAMAMPAVVVQGRTAATEDLPTGQTREGQEEEDEGSDLVHT